MQRFKFGSVVVALGVAVAAFAPMFAAPAVAASSCDAGMSFAFPGTDSGLQPVHCHIDAGVNVTRLATHDAKDVMWHHGAARNVSLVGSPNAITAGSPNIKFAAGTIRNVDVRRPISAFNAAGSSMFKGGTFVYSVSPTNCTSNCTQATLSQNAALTGGTSGVPITAKIEHTYNRVAVDGTCAAGTNTLTSASAKFVAGDLGKSVSGGPMATGTFITSVGSATTVTLNQTHTNGCTPQNPYPGAVITIGAWTYVGGVPQVFNGDALTKHLSNTTGGGTGFTCAGSALSMTAGAKADTGGFVAGDVLLKVVVKGSTTVTGTITGVNVAGNTSATIVPACPGGITATAGSATIGILNAKAPRDNNVTSNFSWYAVVNPSLVVGSPDCSVGSSTTFTLNGSWTNPSITAYLPSAFTPRASVAQVRFITSVLSFPGFVVPKRGTDAVNAIDPHYDLSIPVLPSSLVNCLSAGVPANSYDLLLTNAMVSPFTPPPLPALSGNPGDPNLRILLPLTGTFSQTVEAPNDPNSPFPDPTPCTVGVFACP